MSELFIPKHNIEIDQETGSLIISPALPSSVIIRLGEEFGENNFGVGGDEEATILDITHLQPNQKGNMLVDLGFYAYHPNTPIENVCSRLNNFHPDNKSQQEAFEWVNRLIDYGGSRAGGIYIWGGSGIGKSHLAIGAAKEISFRKYREHFINTHNEWDYYKLLVSLKDKVRLADSFWVIDDLNSPYGSFAEVFDDLVYVLHDHSGKMIVTSNVDFDQFQEKRKLIVGAKHGQRYVDRIKNLFRAIHLEGESRRPDSAWFQP